MITDKDAHALRGIIEVMKRTNQDPDAGLSFLGTYCLNLPRSHHIQRECIAEFHVSVGQLDLRKLMNLTRTQVWWGSHWLRKETD